MAVSDSKKEVILYHTHASNLGMTTLIKKQNNGIRKIETVQAVGKFVITIKRIVRFSLYVLSIATYFHVE
jgi:hypothetical protein